MVFCPPPLSLSLSQSLVLLQESEEDGLRIFTEESAEVESWPRAKVTDHLSAVAPQLVIPYLVSYNYMYIAIYTSYRRSGNFAEFYFRVLNFSVFNFRHLASVYMVGFVRLIFATQVTGENFNGENSPIYGTYIVHACIHVCTDYAVSMLQCMSIVYTLMYN